MAKTLETFNNNKTLNFNHWLYNSYTSGLSSSLIITSLFIKLTRLVEYLLPTLSMAWFNISSLICIFLILPLKSYKSYIIGVKRADSIIEIPNVKISVFEPSCTGLVYKLCRLSI